MRTALRGIVQWAGRRGIRISASSLSRMVRRLELPVLGPLALSPSEISVDGMYVKLWDKTRPPGWETEKAVVLLAVNHDPRLQEKVIGMVFAPAETEEGYRSLADQLLSRGMDAHAPLVIVSDGAQAIPAGFSRSFSNVAFQRCQWHLAQEVKDLAPPSAKEQARHDAWWVLRAATTEAKARDRLHRLKLKDDAPKEALAALQRGLHDATLCLRQPVFSAPTAAPSATSASSAATTGPAKPFAPTQTPSGASPSGPLSSTPHTPAMTGSPTSSPPS